MEQREPNHYIPKVDRDIYEELINDNELNESLMGHAPGEFDEGLALNYHEDRPLPEDQSHIRPDGEIEGAIKELIHNSSRLDGRDITVTIDNRNVTLSGTVKTQEERDYALSVARLVHGVGNIHSDLIVKRNEGILPTDIGRNP